MRSLFKWFARPTVDQISAQLPTSELKKRVKIVVVDDEEDSFPTKALQADGYTVEWWNQVEPERLRRLEAGDFDIVILDIQDIVTPALSDTGDGLGVLRRLKSVNPGQVVVAFSGKAYDLDAVPFWKMADDALRKPVTLIQCKELLDRLIDRHVSVLGYWANIQRLLEDEHVSQKRIDALERRLVESVKAGQQLTPDSIRAVIGDIDKVVKVYGWAQKLFILCTTTF